MRASLALDSLIGGARTPGVSGRVSHSTPVDRRRSRLNPPSPVPPRCCFDTLRARGYYALLMNAGRSLPAWLHPLRYAESGRSVSGTVPVAGMHRLLDALTRSDVQVQVELHFGRDGSGLAEVRGSVRATLSLTCQRCMHPVEIELDLPVLLGIVESEVEAEQLPESHEPLLVDEEPIRLQDLIEDELILGLPLVALHPRGSANCKERYPVAPGDDTRSEQSAADDTNPFSVLVAIKKRGDGDRD